MSIPNIHYGDYGDEKVTSSTRIGNLPLGQLMVLPDGRKFRHAKSGGTALAVGTVLRQGWLADTVMDQEVTINADHAAGSVSIDIITGGTTVTANYYKDGYLYTSLSAGAGSVYKIASHDATATSAEVLTLTLEEHDSLAGSVVATSCECGLRRNEYAACLLNPTGTEFTGMICGVPPVAVSAGYYFWCQRSGVAVGMNAAASAIVGESVTAASSEAGSITIAATGGEDPHYDVIGHGLTTGDAATYVLFNLELE